MKKFKALQSKRQFIRNKVVVGLDPTNPGRPGSGCYPRPKWDYAKNFFTFNVNHQGFHHLLWDKLNQRIEKFNTQNLVFAVETSCNLWQPLCFYPRGCGYSVLLVSPLTTKHSRPLISHDFSRTDPKDAQLIASNARDGYFDFYQDFTPHSNATHRLSITYDKLCRNYVQTRLLVFFSVPSRLCHYSFNSNTMTEWGGMFTTK